MKQLLALIIALSSLVAIFLQLDLMLSNSSQLLGETLIRFFSFFTILTNSLVAGYFSYLSYHWIKRQPITKNEFTRLTAITVYISIVGLVYQVLLRHIWSPTGLQKVVDELLHSVVPVLVVIFWLISRKTGAMEYKQIGSWLIYPLVYLVDPWICFRFLPLSIFGCEPVRSTTSDVQLSGHDLTFCSCFTAFRMGFKTFGCR